MSCRCRVCADAMWTQSQSVLVVCNITGVAYVACTVGRHFGYTYRLDLLVGQQLIDYHSQERLFSDV